MTECPVLGIDPGLHLTGYGLLDFVNNQPRIREAGVIRVPETLSLGERLMKLHQSVDELLAEHKPRTIAVEDLFSHYQHPRTAIMMGHARGVILLAAGQREISVVPYLPTRVKKSMTGNGHASKAQMQQAVKLQFGLKDDITVPDVADALAIALCHLNTLLVQRRSVSS